jgi:hypothetical protein
LDIPASGCVYLHRSGRLGIEKPHMLAKRFITQLGPFILCVALIRPAIAQEQTAPADPSSDKSPPPVTDGAAPPGAAPTTAPNLTPGNFDFFADDKDATVVNPDAERVAAAASLRRSRLHTHQILGITTWALTLTTAVVGQLNYNDVYGSGGGRTGNYLWPHRLLGYATAATFATAAAYALLAPTPYKRPLKLDSSLVHRVAVVGAALGMVAQVALGFYTGRKADAGNGSGLQTDAQIHLGIGYATLGFLTIAGAVWVF